MPLSPNCPPSKKCPEKGIFCNISLQLVIIIIFSIYLVYV